MYKSHKLTYENSAKCIIKQGLLSAAPFRISGTEKHTQ